jgi:hypothetical protein
LSLIVPAPLADILPAGRRNRRAIRRSLRLPGRLIWRDTRGALRFVAVETRDLSDDDAFVVCQSPTTIPLYRLVHFQIEPVAHGHSALPDTLRRGRLLAAVYRTGPHQPSTGTPDGYALRLLVEPTGPTGGPGGPQAARVVQ